jgi:dodecin
MAVAKISEIKASSPLSFDDAIKEGMKRASKTLRNIKSAWISDFEIRVGDDGQISEYRVLMRVTFILED